MKWLDKLFKLRENRTTIRTEIVAGITTFMTMAYIVALNPNILTDFGNAGTTALWNGVFLATCLSAAIGTLIMALLANKPFALAPGMGLNSFFAVVVANIAAITSLSYLASFQAALCLILIEGVVFILLSLFNLRDKLVTAIPVGIRLGISPAIGLMLLNIGFGSNAGIYDEGGNVYYVLRDFFGALTPGFISDKMGDAAYAKMVLTVATMFVGLFAIVILSHYGVKAAVLLGMLLASVIYWLGQLIFLGENPFAAIGSASFLPPFQDMAETTLFKFNFAGLLEFGIFNIITLVITFCMIDLFDTIGTLVGTANRAGMVDENGNMPEMKEALLSDAIATTAGAALGTSTVTTFVESASGVEAGGRTGLASLTTALLFFLCIFLAPIVAIIPPAATSAALIYVGVLMLGGLKAIDFTDISVGMPSALMLIAIPISGSIGHGIGIGMIAYTVIKLCTGKAREVSVLTYVISALFLIKFFLIV